MSDTLFRRLVIVLLLGALGLWGGIRLTQNFLFSAVEPRAVTPRGELSAAEATTISIFEKAAPSVVFINTVKEGRSFLGEQTAAQVGAGSGFVWDRAGHVITNNHVVEGASRVFVRFGTDAAIEAQVVGRAPDHDLAVLKVDRPPGGLVPLPVGRSSNLKVGQATFAIGNPFGLDRTLTTGVVSALERRLPTKTGREITGVIQTDAAINPGNSGGPLLDSSGRLIGVNTAIVSDTGAYSGIGFAIPVDAVNRFVPQLIARGSVPRPGIGIEAAPEELAARAGAEGVVVARVAPNGPAATAGLEGVDAERGVLGDVIRAVNGKPVHTVSDLANELEEVGVGNTAKLTVARNGREREADVRVADLTQR